MSWNKAWGLPSDVKQTLNAFMLEMEKFEEKDVNNFPTEKKKLLIGLKKWIFCEIL